eukprot:TRINITY_DN12011_c0_g1_i4.p1 TRINITY_DN12011_c0_g1~~TRINITY_DN12011_c0_g1_i4.p1  ORF type:complete len:120 (-),score=11.25 TRINITY_DN12011_c0_g1_i4:117-476(-)
MFGLVVDEAYDSPVRAAQQGRADATVAARASPQRCPAGLGFGILELQLKNAESRSNLSLLLWLSEMPSHRLNPGTSPRCAVMLCCCHPKSLTTSVTLTSHNVATKAVSPPSKATPPGPH